MRRLVLLPFLLVALVSPEARAVDVSVEIGRSFCASLPRQDLQQVTWHRLSPSVVELHAWHVETGGCSLQPASIEVAVAGRTIAISQRSKCPPDGAPVVMCADYVLGVYRLQGLDSSTYNVILPKEAIVGHVAIDG